MARHAFRFAASDEPAYFGLALTQRNVIAVTGACMLMRRTMYQALGGFDEAHEIINNDLDFCLRAHQAGKLVVFTPHACLEMAEIEHIGQPVAADRFMMGQ
jgi:GT2 family glycosyltransferase